MSFCVSMKLSTILLNILIYLSAFVRGQDGSNSCTRTGEYTGAKMGACYGTLGNNLPPPTEMIDLCNQRHINRIRLYNPNPSILQALQGQDISVIVGVANEDIIGIARDANVARSWVQNNVVAYSNVNFRYIAVGNEINPLNSGSSDIAPSVAPAMQNIYDALTELGFSDVKVSTALSMGVLGQSYPPSTGSFRADIRSQFIEPIVQFLVKTGSPFLLNVYPYFAYVDNPKDIRLDYALFTSTSTVVRDGNLEYQNLFDAMVDAVHAALERAGGGDVKVVVSETGWPSGGGTAASISNAWIYNSNLVKSVKRGTPRKPGQAVEAYIFDLIDENQKSPEYEKHWGLFLANKRPKYPM